MAAADAATPAQLTPVEGRVRLAALRPAVSGATDLARARGRLPSGPGTPSRMPGDPPLFVGSSAHACDVDGLARLGITAVLNVAPSVCRDPVTKYISRGITYFQLEARDDRTFAIIEECLPRAREFVAAAHASGRGVLIHCMAGVNRSATLAVAYLLLRDRVQLLELFAQCVAARPSILQNAHFQLQLCVLAEQNGLLCDPDKEHKAAAPKSRKNHPLPALHTL